MKDMFKTAAEIKKTPIKARGFELLSEDNGT